MTQSFVPDEEKQSSEGMLSGVKVLEIAHYIAGPHCAMQLADHGAAVIKVEPPTGDPGRFALPLGPEGDSLYFASHNRGKRSVCLDLRSSRGTEALELLLRWSDVVVTNYSNGVPDRLGFGFERLSEINPAASLIHITGFGSKSSRRDYVAFDGAIQAMSGFVALTGQPDTPYLSQVMIADHTAATHASLAAVSAVLESRRTGRGRFVEISMQAAMTSMLAHFIPAYDLGGDVPLRRGNRSPTRFADLFSASDGPIYAAPLAPEMWVQFCDLLGHPEWVPADGQAKPEYVTNEELRRKIDVAANEWFSRHTAEEALSLLQGRGIVAGVVQGVGDIYEEAISEGGTGLLFVELPASGTRVAVPCPGFTADGDNQETLKIPGLGADTINVLAEIQSAYA